MIGARREFLDPVEMADFNGNLVKVLAITGAFRKMQLALDKVIDQVKAGKKGAEIELPKIIMTTDKAVDGEFTNNYALAKARAAHEIAMAVAGQNVKGCFMTKEWEKYIPIVASAHEMMRTAAMLCDEAREIEKAGDSIHAPAPQEGWHARLQEQTRCKIRVNFLFFLFFVEFSQIFGKRHYYRFKMKPFHECRVARGRRVGVDPGDHGTECTKSVIVASFIKKNGHVECISSQFPV